MIHTQKNNLAITSIWKLVKDCFKFHYAGLATWSIFITILTLSLLAGLRFEASNHIFMAGELATQNVFADRTLKIEDAHATLLRRDQTMALQPLIFDLDKNTVQKFRNSVINLLKTLSSNNLDIESLTQIQEDFNQTHSTTFNRTFFIHLAQSTVQEYISSTLLPYSQQLLLEGVFPNNITNTHTSAILIRDTELGNEVLLTSDSSLPSLNGFHLRLGQKVRDAKLSNAEKNSLLTLIEFFAPSTLKLNKEATTKRATTVVNAIPAIFYYIQKGELLVAKGELVTREQQLKMQALYKFSSGKIDIIKALGMFCVASIIALGFFISPTSSTGSLLYPRVQFFIASLILLFSLLAMLLGWFLQTSFQESSNIWVYAFPVAGITALSSLVFAARRFYTIGFLLSLFASVFLHGELPLFLFFFLTSMINTLLILKAQSRQDVVISSLVLLLMQIFVGCGTAMLNLIPLPEMPYLIIALLLNTTFSIFIIFALSPLVEMFFELTTRFRLMELMNFDHPLLQQLMLHTPGTYHHSIVVSSLAEAGANAVKANPLLAKVGALYHDIGKITRPEYFVENQSNGINKHDTLAPAMSALIIISHVKQGVELAEKYKLGREITDIIAEHHGNRCISYFYQKALNNHNGQNETPKESDFSYPNSRPMTKEAALVMLADAVEASSRTLSDPTPARIESHVKKIVQGIYSEGQLDSSELTFRDLNRLSEAFIRILNGLFHQRIAYPEKKKTTL